MNYCKNCYLRVSDGDLCTTCKTHITIEPYESRWSVYVWVDGSIVDSAYTAHEDTANAVVAFFETKYSTTDVRRK